VWVTPEIRIIVHVEIEDQLVTHVSGFRRKTAVMICMIGHCPSPFAFALGFFSDDTDANPGRDPAASVLTPTSSGK
jgi:hypothetical protein